VRCSCTLSLFQANRINRVLWLEIFHSCVRSCSFLVLFRPFPLVVLSLRAIVPVVCHYPIMCVIVPARVVRPRLVLIGRFFSRASLSLAVLFSVRVRVLVYSGGYCACTTACALSVCKEIEGATRLFYSVKSREGNAFSSTKST
jgi:hypothetical protein